MALLQVGWVRIIHRPGKNYGAKFTFHIKQVFIGGLVNKLITLISIKSTCFSLGG